MSLFKSIFALALLGATAPALGSTIELAHRADGRPIVGVKLEGDIERGDALKLLALYEKYGDKAVSPVYLRSKGGEVEEAIKLGRLIRQLRLGTEVPERYNNEILSPVPAANKDNFVCGSACFLVFAGGVDRLGNFLVLHRPYLSMDAARSLSDLDREVAQKQLMAEVREYLQEMEVDSFFIDKLMWTNSQDGYVTSLADIDDHHLDGIVPSIEEIVLSSCEEPTPRERQLFETSTDPKLREQLNAKLTAAVTCEGEQLDTLRLKAWDRQHEDELQAKCGQMSSQDRQSLMAFYGKPPDQRTDADKQAILPLVEKEDERKDCKAKLFLEISLAALNRYRKAWEEQAAATAPAAPNLTKPNPFDQIDPDESGPLSASPPPH